MLLLIALGLLAGGARGAAAFQLVPASDDAAAGQTLIVEREDVVITFLDGSAGWNNTVVWEGSTPGNFHCGDVDPGFTTVLGRFGARTELALGLLTPNGDLWTTGPGEQNTDGAPHARLTPMGPDTVLVEWEDLPGGGDADFNDCVVELRITRSRRGLVRPSQF